MSGNISARDRVWSAVVRAHNTRLDLNEIKRQIRRDLPDDEEMPNDETIKRVLRAADDLGVLEHTKGSPYWSKKELRSRWPVRA